MATTPAPTIGDSAFCTECGRTFPTTDLVRIGNSLVCANCKPIYAQRLREGAAVTGAVQYGGFWRRFWALLLDGLILGVVNFAVSSILGLVFGSHMVTTPGQVWSGAMLTYFGLSFLINVCVAIAYQVFFLTRSGATPGKMALGVKVIKADGGPITAGLAVGRYLATILDSVILGIGFLMAGFDREKRALHDHICNTRVIRVS